MSPRAAIDTSPLQALWRAGVLNKLPSLFESTFIPQSVADETRWSRKLVGAERVPSLKANRWIQVEAVPADAVREAMLPLFKAHQRRHRGAKAGAHHPDVAIIDGRVIAWVQASKHDRLTYNMPDIEVVVLAQIQGAVAILDDRKALKAAIDLGLKTATTREVVAAMARQGLIADGDSHIAKMLATGYHATVRSANVWDGTP